MSDVIRVRVPATAAVLSTGPDFLSVALGLYNHVSISDSASSQHIVTASDEAEIEGARESGAESPHVAQSAMALEAAQRIFKYLHLELPPVHLHLESAIPLSRGLGSDAAVRVGALVAANAWAQRRFHKSASPEKLLSLAAELQGHPANVAAALLGRLVLSKRVGATRMEATQIPFKYLPGRGPWMSALAFTPDATHRASDEHGWLHDAEPGLTAASQVVEALRNDSLGWARGSVWDKVCRALNQPLPEPLRRANPAFEVLRLALSERDKRAPVWTPDIQGPVVGVTLSGAGPTILVWLHPFAGSSARRQRPFGLMRAIQNGMFAAGIRGQIRKLDIDTHGAQVL